MMEPTPNEGKKRPQWRSARSVFWDSTGKKLSLLAAILTAVFQLLNISLAKIPEINYFLTGVFVTFIVIFVMQVYNGWLTAKMTDAVSLGASKSDAGDGLSREATNEVAYTFYSRVFGLAFEYLEIQGVLREDGSMIVRRQSRLVSHTSGIGAVDHYLLSDAMQGAIDVVTVEAIGPNFRRLAKRIQKATADSLTLTIDILPPLRAKEDFEFVVSETTPPGSITRTIGELNARGKQYPYESFFWDITRPTKRLKMKVFIPESLNPTKGEPDVWYGPSRITCEQEIERIGASFLSETEAANIVLSLDVPYPVAGLRYAIKWIPHDDHGIQEGR